MLAAALFDAADQRQVELHHVRLQVDDALQVGVPGAQVVDDQVGAAARANLLQHACAQTEVAERCRLGDLEVNGAIVKEQRIVRAHQPAVAQLVRVQVDEQRRVGAALERHFADFAAEVPAGALGLRLLK